MCTQRGPGPIQRSCVFVVEGEDDAAFIKHVASRLDLLDRIDVRQAGTDVFRPTVRAVASDPGYGSVRALCVVKDIRSKARDYAAALQSAKEDLIAIELEPPAEALVVGGGERRTGIIILPPEAQYGCLEDLCLSTVEDQPAMRCVDRFFDCLRENALAAPTHLSKARVQVFLASQPEVDIRLSWAIGKGYFPLDHPALAGVTGFVRQLVEAASAP